MHALASHLGCTVGHLEQTMSAREFSDWMAWMATEQVGPFWQRLRHAEVMAAVHNGACEKRGGGVFTWQDFMPAEPAEPMTPERMRAELAAMEDAFVRG